MNKHILYVVGFLSFVPISDAFSQMHQNVSNAGGIKKLSTSEVEWTLGELFVGKIGNSQVTVEQGTHQNSYYITNIDELVHSANTTFKIYPNPATDLIRIEKLGNQNVNSIEVYNLQGALLLKVHDDSSPITTIDFGSMHSGNYILKIYTNKHNSFSYKVEKI
jgi:phage-related tail fiber protein